MKLSISFLKSNYSYEETILKINELEYDGYVHVDICDGNYCKGEKTDISLYLDILEKCNKPLDIHLMVDYPLEYIDKLIKLNPSIISVHVSCKDNIEVISNVLKENNIKMGIVLNPLEDITLLNNYYDLVDLVLLMSVTPGFGGQKFIFNTPFKLEYLKKIRENNNYKFLIEVDGGINDSTIHLVKDYVDIYVSGSYICCSDNYKKQIDKLKNILN